MKSYRLFQSRFQLFSRPVLTYFAAKFRRRIRAQDHLPGRAARILGSLAALLLSLPASAVSLGTVETGADPGTQSGEISNPKNLSDTPIRIFYSAIVADSVENAVIVGMTDFRKSRQALLGDDKNTMRSLLDRLVASALSLMDWGLTDATAPSSKGLTPVVNSDRNLAGSTNDYWVTPEADKSPSLAPEINVGAGGAGLTVLVIALLLASERRSRAS